MRIFIKVKYSPCCEFEFQYFQSKYYIRFLRNTFSNSHKAYIDPTHPHQKVMAQRHVHTNMIQICVKLSIIQNQNRNTFCLLFHASSAAKYYHFPAPLLPSLVKKFVIVCNWFSGGSLFVYLHRVEKITTRVAQLICIKYINKATLNEHMASHFEAQQATRRQSNINIHFSAATASSHYNLRFFWNSSASFPLWWEHNFKPLSVMHLRTRRVELTKPFCVHAYRRL